MERPSASLTREEQSGRPKLTVRERTLCETTIVVAWYTAGSAMTPADGSLYVSCHHDCNNSWLSVCEKLLRACDPACNKL